MDNVLTLNFDLGTKKQKLLATMTGEYPTFIGRNGTGYCNGLEVWMDEEKTMIQPITSQNKIGNCHIEMPTKDLINLIPVSMRPLLIGLHPALDEVLGKKMMLEAKE